MINYLKGTVAAVQKGRGHRVTLVLEVNQIGYEMQILPRMLGDLVGDKLIQIFTHQHVREDQIILYGFSTAAERDLFQQLISVSGIGAQLGMALLDTLGIQDLVSAIVSGNIRLLSTTPGVGKKTAERISLELRTKLSEWRQQSGVAQSLPAGVTPAIQEEVEMTLLALGYTPTEVMQTLQILSQNSALTDNTNIDDWIRVAITIGNQA